MNSHSSNRKPKRKICSTISAVTGTRPASRAVLPADQHRVADADDVAVGERLAGDGPAVDQGAAGRPEVLRDRRAVVQDDAGVLVAQPGFREPAVGVAAAADEVAPGG